MFNLTDNLEAFADGNNMKHMPYAARKIDKNFYKKVLKSIR